MKQQIIILLVAFALFLGCSKENDETESVLKPEIVVMNLGGGVGDAASIKGKTMHGHGRNLQRHYIRLSPRHLGIYSLNN